VHVEELKPEILDVLRQPGQPDRTRHGSNGDRITRLGVVENTGEGSQSRSEQLRAFLNADEYRFPPVEILPQVIQRAPRDGTGTIEDAYLGCERGDLLFPR